MANTKSSAPSAQLPKSQERSRSWLPPGYFLRGYGRLLSRPEEPVFWNVCRPDESPAFTAASGREREEIEHAAWDDHRRRTLYLVDNTKEDH